MLRLCRFWITINDYLPSESFVANSRMDSKDARSNFFTTNFPFFTYNLRSSTASCALDSSLHAIIILAPENKFHIFTFYWIHTVGARKQHIDLCHIEWIQRFPDCRSSRGLALSDIDAWDLTPGGTGFASPNVQQSFGKSEHIWAHISGFIGITAKYCITNRPPEEFYEKFILEPTCASAIKCIAFCLSIYLSLDQKSLEKKSWLENRLS